MARRSVGRAMKLLITCRVRQVRLLVPLFILLTACAERAAPPPAPAGTFETAPAGDAPQTVRDQAKAHYGAESDRTRATQERLVSRHAELTLVSEQVSELANNAAATTAKLGGYLADQRQSYRDEQVVEATLSLKVPAKSFEDALKQLRASARIAHESISTQDVTDEFSDVQAQLRAQHALESRLLKLLDDANNVKSMLEVERELARVRTTIERLSGREQLLKNQTDFATIQLLIQSPEQPLAGPTQSLLSRLENASTSALSLSVSVMIGLIHVTGALLPLLLLLTLSYFGHRLYRRYRHRNANFVSA